MHFLAMMDASGSNNATFSSCGKSTELRSCGRPSFLLEASEEEWIKKARELITPLLAQAGLVQVFKGRWMMISMRLQCLSEALNSLPETKSLQQIFLRHRTTLSQIVGSLVDGRELVQKSIDLSYCGKLLMQSNIDALVTKLDRHLRDLEEMKNCIEQHERAIAIAIAMRSDGISGQYPDEKLTKEQLWGIFAKLRLGNGDSKILLLESLVNYMCKDEKAALLVKNEGDVSRLIHLLDSSLPAIKERAAHIVWMLAMVDECKKGLMAEGIIQPLLRVLESGNLLAKEKAALALFELTCISENAHAVASQGSAISLLVKLCKQGTVTGMAGAGGTLCNLSRNKHMHRVLAEKGAVDALILLLACSSSDARQHAAKALYNLASGKDDKIRSLIARQGGMQSLVTFLKAECASDAQEIAIEALSKFATSETNVKALVLAGYVAHLTELLNAGCPRLKHLAALALCNLSAYMNLKRQTHRVPLFRLFGAQDSSGHKTPAVLKGKHPNMDNRRVPAFSNLLDSCKESSAFFTVSSNSMQRRHITSTETQPQLEKLADTNVEGANKSLRKVGAKKLLHLLIRKARKSKRA